MRGWKRERGNVGPGRGRRGGACGHRPRTPVPPSVGGALRAAEQSLQPWHLTNGPVSPGFIDIRQFPPSLVRPLTCEPLGDDSKGVDEVTPVSQPVGLTIVTGKGFFESEIKWALGALSA